jgi:hypothetical protein
MGRGLGEAQRAMLAALEAQDNGYMALTIAELAETLKVTPRRCREVAYTLRDRGLVIVSLEQIGGKGWNEYGLVEYNSSLHEGLDIITVKKGEPVPGRTRHRSRWQHLAEMVKQYPDNESYKRALAEAKVVRARRDMQFVREGMPNVGLLVWRPEQWQRYLTRWGPVTRKRLIERFGPHEDQPPDKPKVIHWPQA